MKKDINIRFSTKDANIVRRALKEMGKDGERAIKRMDKASRRTRKGLKALDKASRELQTSMRGMASRGGAFGKTLGAFGPAGLAAAAGITALVLAGKQAITVIAKFETEMSGIKAVTAATEAQMKSLEATARDLGSTTIFSASEAASGMRFLGQAGFEVNEIISAMAGMLNLAAAGQLELGQAADITSNIMSAFKLEAEQATAVVDIMAVTAASSNTNILQLGAAMQKVAPIAKAFSDDIKDSAALIGVLGNAGIQAEEAGTGLKQAYIKLSEPSAKLNKILKELNLTYEDINPSTNSLVDVIRKLEDANINATQSIGIFGARASLAFLTIKDALPDFDNLRQRIEGSSGAAKEMADIMQDNLVGAFKELLSAISETALVFGEDGGIGDAISNSLSGAASSVREFNDSLTDMVFIARVAFNILTDDEEDLKELATQHTQRLKQQAEAQKLANAEAYNAKVAALNAAAGTQKYVTEITFKTKAQEKDTKETKENIAALIAQEAAMEKVATQLDAQIAGLQQQLELSKLDKSQRNIQIALFKAQAIAKKENIELTHQQRGKIIELTTAIEDEKSAQEQATQAAKFFSDAATDLGDRLVDSFRNGKLEAEDFKDFALDMLAELARAAIIKVVFAPIASSFASQFFGSSVGDAVSKQLGVDTNAGGGISNLTSLAGIKNLVGAGGSFTGGFGAVNQFGANYLGTGLPGLEGAATGVGLSSVLAGGGIGSFGASMLGLGNDNQLINTGAGLAGSYASSILLAPLLGPLAPLAPFIGGFAGSALSGVFGGNSSDIAEFAAQVGSDGGLVDTSFGSKNIGTQKAQQFADMVDGFMRSFSDVLDVDLEGSQVFGGVHSKKGNFLRTDFNAGIGESEFFFNPDDAESTASAFFGLSIELLKNKGGAEDLIAAYEELEKEGKSTQEIILALAISTGKAAEDFNDNLSDTIKQLTDPKSFAIDGIKQEMEALRITAEEFGGDIALVNQLESIRLDLLNEEGSLLDKINNNSKQAYNSAENLARSLKRVSQSLEAALFDLKVGEFSSLSPADKLSEARKLFESTSTRANLGNLQALESLPDIGNSFLSLSREFNASSQAFKSDVQVVENSLIAAKEIADRDADRQIQIAENMLSVLNDIKHGILNGGNISDIETSISSNIIRPDETATQLAQQFNQLNQLPAMVVRNIKAQLGFDFADSDNQGISFKQFAAGNSNLQDSFNNLIVEAGGRAQAFAEGGIVRGGVAGRDSVAALLTSGEIVVSNRDVDAIIGGQRGVVQVLQNGFAMMEDQMRSSIEKLEELVDQRVLEAFAK